MIYETHNTTVEYVLQLSSAWQFHFWELLGNLSCELWQIMNKYNEQIWLLGGYVNVLAMIELITNWPNFHYELGTNLV